MVSRVFMIVDAYESGVGHGLQNDGLDDGDAYYADYECAEAYTLGYQKGQEMRGQGQAEENNVHALVAGVEALMSKPDTPETRETIDIIKRIFAKKGVDDGSAS